MKSLLSTILSLTLFSSLPAYASSTPVKSEPQNHSFILPVIKVESVLIEDSYALEVSVSISEKNYGYTPEHVNPVARLSGPLKSWIMSKSELFVKFSDTDINLVSESRSFQKPGEPLNDWFNELSLFGYDFIAKFTLQSEPGTSPAEVARIASLINEGVLFQISDAVYGEDFDSDGA